MAQDQRRFVELRNDVRHRERFTRTGYAQQRVVAAVAAQRRNELFDRFGLVAGRFIIRYQFEIHGTKLAIFREFYARKRALFGGKSYLCGNYPFYESGRYPVARYRSQSRHVRSLADARFVSERTTRREKVRFLIVIGLFHFLMILAGWLFGANVSRLIADYDHWIAFFLLAFLGAKMIREGLSAVQDDEVDCDLLSLRNTLMFGIALSIDALITGFSLGLVKVHLYDGSPLGNILLAAALIGTAALFDFGHGDSHR